MSSLRLSLSACLAGALLGACAPASRLIQPEAAATIGLNAASAGGLRISVLHVIATDQAGSWVRGAAWDEFLLVLAADGNEAVVVDALEIASVLPENAAHTRSRVELEGRSQANIDAVRALGVAAGTVTGVTLAYGLGTYAALGGSVATGVVAIVALPVIAIGGPVYLIRKSLREDEDRKLIEDELARRGLVLPATIVPGKETRGSAFFPLTPDPRRLVVRYRRSGVPHNVEMELPARVVAAK